MASRTLADAIADEVDAIEDELRRIDHRLAALNWEPAPHRMGGETWADFCFGRPVERDDGDLPQQVLQHKRLALLLELARLRQRLIGQPPGNGRGWG